MIHQGPAPTDGARTEALQVPPLAKGTPAKPETTKAQKPSVGPRPAGGAIEPADDLAALEKLVSEINLQVPDERGIRFDLSGEGDDLVVQVVDKGSDEVIREIPPDRLKGLRSFFSDLTGALLDDTA